jgi:hypothetical protein
MPATLEEVHGPSALEYFEQNGLTMPALTKLLKRELKAKVTKSIKIKGAVSPDQLGRGRRIVAASGTIIQTKDGNVFGDGETVIEWDEVAWDVRQRARMDVHKLRGDYPAEKREITGAHSGPLQMLYEEIVGKATGLVNDHD